MAASCQMNGVNGSPRKKARINANDNNRVTVVLGAQWGDEGKGKVVDMLATEVDVVCRCQINRRLKSRLAVSPRLTQGIWISHSICNMYIRFSIN